MSPRGTLPTLLSRREQAIVRLLETSTLNLPTSSPQSTVASGFVHKARSRACPDCLANGRISLTCETCFGRGHIDPVYAKNVASTDALPDDDDRRDPYSVNDDRTRRYGLDGSRHDQAHARDRQIEALARQTRPAQSEAQLLAEANDHPFAWERAREQMRKRFDYDALDIALELLRQHDPVAYRALHAVYVYGWLREVTGAAEAACRRGLRFLSPRLAAVELARGKALRAPDMEPETRVGYGPLRPEAGSSTKALRDAAMRRAADEGASVAQLMERFRVSKSTVYSVVNQRDAA